MYWPSSDERRILAEKTMHELPYCIFYTDGTEVELAEAPTFDKDSYLSRNNVYALKLQGTCDYTKALRHVNIGYPGNVHDARIFNECVLATDSAYKLRTTVITPFRKNSKQLNASARKDFNRFFSSYRVRVEHTFGIMKEKLPSLKKLAIKIIDQRSHKFACDWIRVCCILHNILLGVIQIVRTLSRGEGGSNQSVRFIHFEFFSHVFSRARGEGGSKNCHF